MGITHHSNYVRWMEEARFDFMTSAGYGMKRLEADGITSPVVSVECRYISPSTFDDKIRIDTAVERYNGVKLEMSYKMTNAETGKLVMTAKSSHCFIDRDGTPIAVRKRVPEFDALLLGFANDK